AEALRVLGRHEEALSQLESPRDATWARVNLALVFAATGSAARMRAEFALLPPALKGALARLAPAQLRRAPDAAVEAELRRALAPRGAVRLGPPGARVSSLEKGISLFNAGKFKEALAAFERAEPERPVDAAAFRAHCLFELGRRERALGLFRSLLERDPDC